MNDIRDDLNRRRVVEEQRVIRKRAEDWEKRIPGLNIESRRLCRGTEFGQNGAVALILSRETKAGEERLWTGFNYASQSIVRAEKIVRRLEGQL